MSRFVIDTDTLDDLPVWCITDTRHGSSCRVAARGATLLSFRIPGPDGAFEVIDGYPDAAALTSLKGSRSAIMMPFTNRVADGTYAFEGVRHQLPERRDDGNAIHGLVRGVDWTVVDQSTEEGWVLLRCDALTGGDTPGYPYAVECFVRVRLDGGELEVALSAANTGQRTAPVGMGWHPYLRAPGGDIAPCRLELPAAQRIVTDNRQLPLHGDRAYAAVADTPWDYRAGRAVDTARLDTCFTALTAEADGWIRSRLTDPARGYTAVVAQRRGAVQVYTPPADDAGRRERIAVEPTEFPPDAFNRPECHEALALAPGGDRTFLTRITAGFE